MEPTEEPIGRMLAHTTKLVQAAFDSQLATRGGGLTTFLVLKYAMQAEGSSQSALAQGMGVEAPTMVRHIDRMEREGLVERHRDPRDRRAVQIKVTPAGRTLFFELVEVMVASNDELLAQLSENEARVLRRALTKLHNFYQGNEGRPHGSTR
jgi:MarR family transcriptional regulator for hemolysin